MIVLSGEPATVVALCFLPGTRLLAAGDQHGTVTGWDLDTRATAFIWRAGRGSVHALAAGAGGRRVYATLKLSPFTSARRARVYDRQAGTDSDIRNAGDFALNPAGTRVLTVSRRGRGRIRCWKVSRTGDPALAWTGPSAVHSAFFPDSRRFAAYDELYRPPPRDTLEPYLLIGDAATGAVRIRVRAHYIPTGGPLVHPDGTRVVGAFRTRLVVWDAATGDRVTTAPNPHSKFHFTGAFHPSGRRLATAGDDRTVRLWDTDRWQPAHALDWGVGKVRSVAYSPDGLLAAAGSDRGRVVVWDVDE